MIASLDTNWGYNNRLIMAYKVKVHGKHSYMSLPWTSYLDWQKIKVDNHLTRELWWSLFNWTVELHTFGVWQWHILNWFKWLWPLFWYHKNTMLLFSVEWESKQTDGNHALTCPLVSNTTTVKKKGKKKQWRAGRR